MAFVSTIQPLPARVTVERDGSAEFVVQEIGFDDENPGTAYLLSVALDVMAGGGHELVFSIIETSEGGDRIMRSGRDTRGILVGKDRRAVLERLLELIDFLVRVVRPESISIYTVDVHLPERALVKYHLICDRIVAIGYRLRQPEQYHGQWGWILNRADRNDAR